ncbi:unnamed protein product [Tilletia controversa]|uniref:Tyrosyl-DNA phosphodiesterase 1 n=1 Tax=Tilletia controversa TaxID=13291 RepID=A0A8X7MRR7_9BASI|nr:hypothetical protein CF328_g4891 [Tilletia controversa]KAE8245573.1 hypothetical protein A4X06_0g5583 [Tilletia controversa]CAD6896974.1 unnamed protein product [Tilletia controversa]CAD6933096.1 unnamed protein product [Tilletia controversa]CAD6939853.1 unnamed protein product [Tilletia controversa]
MPPPPPPGTEHNRAARKNEPIAIDSDSDSDGFEITGTTASQEPKSQPSSSRPKAPHSKPEAQPEESPVGADALRSLVPDRAKLEQERLERARKRQQEQGSLPLDPAKIPDVLDGRPPASMLDGKGAAQAVMADREAQSVINAALRNVGLGSAGISSKSAVASGRPAVSNTAGIQPASSAAAASSSAQAVDSAGLYWWNGLTSQGPSQSGTSSSASSARAGGPSTKLPPPPSSSSASPAPNAAPSTRINKRPRSNEGMATNSPGPAEQPVAKRRQADSVPVALPASSTYDANATIQLTDRFWHGTVKHSFNCYAPTSEPGVRMVDMVQPRGRVSASSSLSGRSSSVETRLEEVVASSYCCDFEWLANEVLPTGKSWAEGGTCPEITFIAHSSDPNQRGVLPKMQGLPNWTIIMPIHPSAPPPRASGSSGSAPARGGFFYGVMHCKFIVLFYPKSHMRFILLSGNLVEHDWDQIENTAFMQDFPALSASDLADDRIRARKSTSSPFGIELLKLFNVLSLPKQHSARARLAEYDLSQAVGSLVISAPQRQAPSAWDQVNQWGVGRLGAVIRAPFAEGGVGLQPVRSGVDLEAQGSSLGDLRLRWLQHFHLLASGIDPTAGGRPALPLPGAAAKASQKYGDLLWPPASVLSALSGAGGGSKKGRIVPGLVAPQGSTKEGTRPPPRKLTRLQRPSEFLCPPIRICFPTARWVKESAVEGPPGAGTFFAKKQKFLEGSFKHLFYQPVSKRGNVMMHAKTLIGLQPGYDLEDALVVSPSSAASIQEGKKKTGFASSGSTLGAASSSSSGPDRDGLNGKGKGKGKAQGGTATDSILISDSDDSEREAGINGTKKTTTKGTLSTGDASGEGKGKGKSTTGANDAKEGGGAGDRREAIGWVYCGSHNFTPSAWGTITDKKEIPSISMSNWEVGIVFPLFDARDAKQGTAADEGFDLHAHVSTLARNAVVYRRPLEPYRQDDVPWDQTAPENLALLGGAGS